MKHCKNKINVILKEGVRKVNPETGHVWYDHKNITACIQGDDYQECTCNL